jgi:hypothetical protein
VIVVQENLSHLKALTDANSDMPSFLLNITVVLPICMLSLGGLLAY